MTTSRAGLMASRKTRTRAILLAVILVGYGIYGVVVTLRTPEPCPYSSTEPASGVLVRICYKKAVPWMPLMWEGYYVYADLYDARGVHLRRELVNNVDIPEDVEQWYSKIRWDPALGAFVDNEGQEVIRLEAKPR